jgi:hypothetical protein
MVETMTFKKGKQKFSKEEIIDILKRNVALFKDEEEFVQYVVDLATYLIEHRIQTSSTTPDPTATDPGSAIMPRKDLWRTRERDQELYGVLKKHAPHGQRPANCRMCGAPTRGLVTCPNCGNMSF